MGDMPGYVDADYLRRAARMGQQLKQRSYELLRLEPGMSVLDVGCGPGVDTVPMAELVGESGSVAGVDNDPAMIAEAEDHAAAAGLADRVIHRAAGVEALPFDNGAFDAVRAERLLQVLPESVGAADAVAEMVRVLKPGGWLVVTDADWGSASVDFSDPALERRLLLFFAERLRPNGYAGRQLLGMMHAQGLQSLRHEVLATVHNDLSLLPFEGWLPDEAVKAGVVSETDAQSWRDELARRAAAGSLHATVNMVTVAGRK